MNISITAIKIHIISNLGSFNIGKTILCKNASTSQYTTPTAALSSEQNDTHEGNARTDS